MALLYYCYWGGNSINCQSLIGYGTSTYPKTTGQTDQLGMTETAAVGNGNTGSINFWGLENWWGDLTEYIDDLITADTNGTINILNYNGSVNRQVSIPISNGCISKFVFGQYADMLPAAINGSNYTIHFCDYGYVDTSFGSVALRSYLAAMANGGVGYLYIGSDSSSTYAHVGSRLLYNGAVTEVDSL